MECYDFNKVALQEQWDEYYINLSEEEKEEKRIYMK